MAKKPGRLGHGYEIRVERVGHAASEGHQVCIAVDMKETILVAFTGWFLCALAILFRHHKPFRSSTGFSTGLFSHCFNSNRQL